MQARTIWRVLLVLWCLAMGWAGVGRAATPLAAGGAFAACLPLVHRNYPPYPYTPWLAGIANDDGDGNYTLTWSVALLAETYELQEQWQGGEWYTAYSGPLVTMALANRPPGDYAYRCRSHNAFGDSDWSNSVTTTVQGQAPGTISRPSSSQVSADGQAVIKVINDCPYVLHLEFTGPTPEAMQMTRCDVCKVYSFMGPFFCPTSGRPVDETRVGPGPYRVYVWVDQASVRPYVGHWELQGDRRYTVCFYIVQSWGAGDRFRLTPCPEGIS